MKYTERKRWLFLGLPWTFTKYTFEDEKITINRGCLNTTEDSLYMYKVIDIKLQRSFLQRIAGLGTIVCYTGDVTDSVLKITNIKHAKVINDYIFEVSEEQRRKRRTLNTQNLSANIGDLSDDIDDIEQ